MADDVLLGGTKEPVVQSILAASGEESQKPPSISPLKGGGQNWEFFVDMETIAFGYALLVGDGFTCTLGNSLNMRDDTLRVLYRLTAVVVRA